MGESNVQETPHDQEAAFHPNPHRSFLDRWIESGGRWFSFLFLASGLVIVFEIVSRYVFNAPTIWGHELTTALCAVCFAYGGSYCLARNTHIRIVFLYDSVPRPVRKALDIFNALTGLVWGGFLVYAGTTLVEKAFFAPWGEFRMETSASAWDTPSPALIKGFLLIALIVMTLQFLLQLINILRKR